MRDTVAVFGLGLTTFWGSALDSQGAWFWVAVVGVLVGLALFGWGSRFEKGE